MRNVSRTRSMGLLVATIFLFPLPAAGAADSAEHIHLDDGVEVDVDAEVSLEEIVYDMYFPIQGGAEYNDNFGDCRGGSSCPRTHHGIDIMLPKMTPVLAVASGYVGWMHDGTDPSRPCCAFEINHDDGWESWYIHLNNDTPGTDDGLGWGFAPGVVRGARIEAGQLIGWVGDSGNAENSGPHLHFELHKPGGTVINPYPSLQAATVLNVPLGNGHTRGCDFNGDGYDDLAVGVPGEDLGGNRKVDAGSVTVMLGSPDGLSAAGARAISQGTAGVSSSVASDEEFGFATVCGDVDNDGHDDLIVGVPGSVVGGRADAGGANLILGSADGFEASGKNFWHQNRRRVGDKAQTGDRFGEAMAAGDFNGDGYADVAVGAPGERVARNDSAGMVTVLYGSQAGFDGTSNAIREDVASIGVAEAGDRFGAALAAGDFDNDGNDDLAVGIPGEDGDTGAVVILYGSAAGIDPASAVRLTQDTSDVAGGAAAGDGFGSALAVGDFDNDDRFDLAIGVPGDDDSSGAGAVNVLYGSDAGIRGGDQLLQQGSGGLRGTSVAGDRFGAALAVGDFDGNGSQDLVVGAPGKQIAGAAGAGSVAVVYGSGDGLTADGDDVWSQDSKGIRGVAQAGDRFGGWLTSGDFAGVGVSALAVGVPLEDVGTRVDSGAMQIILGRSGKGLVAGGDQSWSQKSAGIPSGAEAGDGFGRVARPST